MLYAPRGRRRGASDQRPHLNVGCGERDIVGIQTQAIDGGVDADRQQPAVGVPGGYAVDHIHPVRIGPSRQLARLPTGHRGQDRARALIAREHL